MHAQDDSLPELLASNLDAYFEHLVLRYQHGLHAFAQRHTGNSQLAEDIVQVDSPHLKTTINSPGDSLGGVATTSAEHIWVVGMSANGGRGISPLIETLCGS
jgi:hypothetical protein